MMTATLAEGGQASFTSFKRMRISGDFSLVECYPRTGRQHQIRVHLEAAGFPIVGDKLYGIPEAEALRFYERSHLTPEAEARLLLPRHALHAAGIEFEHPRTGEPIEFRSPLPPDLTAFLENPPEPLPTLLPLR
jgi:23S rRNA pseudouridine1911/1915/1917 synthase